MTRPTVTLPDGRRAEIIRYGGHGHYRAIIRQCGRERLPVAKVTIRRDDEGWAVVREDRLALVAAQHAGGDGR
jgi:hypothetical protein